MTDFKDCYFETNSAEETKALLKYLDLIGARWTGGDDMVACAGEEVYESNGVFLINRSKYSGFCYLGKNCSHQLLSENFIKGLQKVVLVFKNVLTVDSAEIENTVVELNGKKYNKSDLEQALKLIKPVE